MAILDLQRDLIVVRIVYDGSPMSGKTTSVRILAEGLKRPTVTPDHVQGRTLYFDWMDYVGGMFDGHRIRCQIVSVPGQLSLVSRRKFLLSTADSVVFVADTTAPEWRRSRSTLEQTYEHVQRSDGPPVGVVLQANKRDAIDAVPLSTLREDLRLRSALGIVETVATEGRGIREAFVFGVRLALDRVRESIRQGRLAEGVPEVDDPESLLSTMFDAESRETIVYAPDKRTSRPPQVSIGAGEANASPADAPAIAPPGAPAIAIAERAPSAEPAALAQAELPAPEEELLPIADETELPSETSLRSLGMDAALALRYPEAASTLAYLARQDEKGSSPAASDMPALPNGSVPSGRIWPPVEGRVLLNEVDAMTHDSTPERTPEGHWQLHLPSSEWTLHSHADSEFDDVRQGELELLAWARLHAGGKHRLSEGRCIVLAQAGPRRWRLWQIVRRRPSIETLVRQSLESGNAPLVARTLFDAARLLAMAHRSFNEPPCRLPCTVATVGNADWRAVFLGLFPGPLHGHEQRAADSQLDVEFVCTQLDPIVRSHAGIGRIDVHDALTVVHRLTLLHPDQRTAAEAVRTLLA